jgi:glycosyltransferase involved in cell wall biosynthesis
LGSSPLRWRVFRMRILYFSASCGPHDQRFLNALAETEHEVAYLQLGPEARSHAGTSLPSRIRQVAWSGAKRAFAWHHMLVLVPELRRVLQNIQPHVVHAGPIQTCAFLAVLSGYRPVLTMSWGFDLMQDAERNAWYRFVTRYTLKRSTLFTSDARVTRSRAVHYGMREDRTMMFPWGVDLQHFAPGASRQMIGRTRTHRNARPGSPKTDFTILCNRSWEPRYGVDVLARAFVRAAPRNPRLRLILMGAGSQGPALRNILGNAGLRRRVRFVDTVAPPLLPRWYRAASLFVSPSHVDGSSVSLMEAMACGRPVLVSDIAANKEWVKHGRNGWIFRDGDDRALATAMLALAKDPVRLQRAGKRARSTAERRANWKENFRVLLRGYERAQRIASGENR